MANILFAKLTKALAVIMAATVFAAAHPVAAQDANNPYAFEKKAYKPDGTPWTGPVNVGDTVKYVLTYKPGTTLSGPVTIDDQLSPNLSYVAPTTSVPGWTWGSSPYATGNHETYNLATGMGPLSVKTKVSKLNGDGTKPIPVGNRVFSIYHHALYGSSPNSAEIDCWDLATLTKCPGYPKANSNGNLLKTPLEPNAVVRGSNIYFLGFDSANSKPTIGCFDTVSNSACTNTVLDNVVATAGNTAGLVEDATTGNVYAVVANKVYCRTLSGSIWTTCGAWPLAGQTAVTGTVPATSYHPNLAAIHVEQSASPSRVYVHLGTITVSSVTSIVVQCLELGECRSMFRKLGTYWRSICNKFYRDLFQFCTCRVNRRKRSMPAFIRWPSNSVLRCSWKHVNSSHRT